MVSFFDIMCYLIGLTSAAATLFFHGHQNNFLRNNGMPQPAFAHTSCELNKKIYFRQVIIFVAIWSALISVAIVEG